MKESATRKKILDTASTLFYKQGYNSTGINQVIEEANIARASLYKHFPSKKDLLTAYIKAMEENSFKEWDAFLESIKEPRQKILALFDICIERQMRSNFGGCAFIKISAEVPCDDLAVFELINHQKIATKTYIRRLLEEFPTTKNKFLTKEMLANTLFLLMEGAMMNTTISKNMQDLEEAKKIVESIL